MLQLRHPLKSPRFTLSWTGRQQTELLTQIKAHGIYSAQAHKWQVHDGRSSTPALVHANIAAAANHTKMAATARTAHWCEAAAAKLLLKILTRGLSLKDERKAGSRRLLLLVTEISEGVIAHPSVQRTHSLLQMKLLAFARDR